MAPLWRKLKPSFEVTIDPVWDPIFCLHGKAGFSRIIFMLMWSIRKPVESIIKVLFSREMLPIDVVYRNSCLAVIYGERGGGRLISNFLKWGNYPYPPVFARKHPSLIPADL